MKITRSALAARRWLSRPASSRKRRASALSGTMPMPTSLDTTTVGASASRQAFEPRRTRASRSCSASMMLVSHSVRQSTSTGAPAPALSSAPASSSGASTVDQPAPRRARCMRDALAPSRRPAPAPWRRRSRAAGSRRDQRFGVRLLPERAPPSTSVKPPRQAKLERRLRPCRRTARRGTSRRPRRAATQNTRLVDHHRDDEL